MSWRIAMTSFVVAKWLALACGLLAGAVCLAGGCRLQVSPFSDEFASTRGVTTASVEGARAADAVPTELRRLRRGQTPISIRATDGSVTHGPLYFEDPFVAGGSEDGEFAWTAEDYLYWIVGKAGFLTNGVLLPISVAVSPPGVVMVSDGRLGRRALGRQLDAARWTGPTGPP